MKISGYCNRTLICSLLAIGWLALNSAFLQADPSEQEQALVKNITQQTVKWLDSLDSDQQKKAVLPFAGENRTDWHYIPKRSRKGVKLREMTEQQETLAFEVLKSVLSEDRYPRARRIIDLEKILEVEEKRTDDTRDYKKFFFTVFGDPRQDARWGLSIEGHHLSLNFVFDNGKIVSSTPQFFAANPAIIPVENQFGIEKGSQVLKEEQNLALELLNSLSAEQKQQAIFAERTPRDVHNAAQAAPPQEPAQGLPASQMTVPQQQLLRSLITSYTDALPEPVAARRLKEIEGPGFDQIHFAWAGGTKLGEAHYYRVQGNNVYIEFINHQRDVYGNPNNHIHSVLRNMTGDFDIPVQ